MERLPVGCSTVYSHSPRIKLISACRFVNLGRSSLRLIPGLIRHQEAQPEIELRITQEKKIRICVNLVIYSPGLRPVGEAQLWQSRPISL